jgi:hypothetical protein
VKGRSFGKLRELRWAEEEKRDIGTIKVKNIC